ncbi:MAG: hypothetical protein J3K34DRAFT_409032 [Monoraphidium minutum]|nr:MAG: hypothetical protein J3K34DRAFT_409032 [Monoraphidium minutum]
MVLYGKEHGGARQQGSSTRGGRQEQAKGFMHRVNACLWACGRRARAQARVPCSVVGRGSRGAGWPKPFFLGAAAAQRAAVWAACSRRGVQRARVHVYPLQGYLGCREHAPWQGAKGRHRPRAAAAQAAGRQRGSPWALPAAADSRPLKNGSVPSGKGAHGCAARGAPRAP